MEEALRDEPVRAAANAFARGLKGELVLAGAVEVGEGRAEPTLEVLLSDAAERVLPPIGTVRLFRFCVEPAGDSDDESGRGMRSSGGASSAAGMGRPRAAAMI